MTDNRRTASLVLPAAFAVALGALVPAVPAHADDEPPPARPAGISPGEEDREVQLADGCPSFGWIAFAGAREYELAVRLTEEGVPARSALSRLLPAALFWTPPSDRCLPGGRYVWTIRARTEKGWSEWSVPRRFAVPTPGAQTTWRASVETMLRDPRLRRLLAQSDPIFTAAPCTAGSEIFADVPATSPFCAAIQQMYEAGLTAGCDSAPLRFCPDAPVTRQQLALVLARLQQASGPVQIASGSSHACGIRANGVPVCWGYNGDGQADPIPIGIYTQISAGGFHSCGLRTGGSVACWGGNGDGQTGAYGFEYLQVAAGQLHSCGVLADHQIVCWGSNELGQVGPVPSNAYAQVAAGAGHSCGLTTAGAVVCWGDNGNGQGSPVPPGTYTQIAAGTAHSCGLRNDGTVACWGLNNDGQVSTVPAGTYTQVAAGYLHTCGVLTSGQVRCWGSNGHGQSDPVPAGTFTQVSAGTFHSCGLRTNGVVECWGDANLLSVPPWLR